MNLVALGTLVSFNSGSFLGVPSGVWIRCAGAERSPHLAGDRGGRNRSGRGVWCIFPPSAGRTPRC